MLNIRLIILFYTKPIYSPNKANIQVYTLTRSLKLFNNFINGGRTRAFRKPLKVYDNNLEQLDMDFHQTSIDDPKVQDYIATILESLCVPRKKTLEYLNSKLTVYKFLQELSKDGHIQANYFLEIIDKKTKISKLTLFTGGMISAGFAGCLLANPLLSGVLESIVGFVKSPSGIPILSALCSTGMAAYGIYTILSDGKSPEYNRVRDLTFTILKSVVSLTAQALLIASSVTLMPIVASLAIASLCILSSVINVCKELFSLVQELVQQNKPDVDGHSPFYLHRAYLRHEIASITHRNAAIINFLTAVAVIAVTTASVLAPGGPLLIAGVLMSYALIYGLQYYMLKANDKIMREKLQDGVRNIINDHAEFNEFELQDMNNSDVEDETSSSEYESTNKTVATVSRVSSGGLSFFSKNKSSKANDEKNHEQQLALINNEEDDDELDSNTSLGFN